jgi:hypothetical protein
METHGTFRVTSRVGRPVIVDEWAFPKAVTVNLDGEGTAPDLVAQFEWRDGRPECTDVRVSAKADGDGVTNADLRLFDLENLAARAFQAAASRPLPFGGHAVTDLPPHHAEEVSDVVRGSQASDARLVRVARVYLEDVHGAPLAAVERYLGQSRRTAARWVRRAREAGLIPPEGADAAQMTDYRDRLRQTGNAPEGRSIEEMRELLGWNEEGR